MILEFETFTSFGRILNYGHWALDVFVAVANINEIAAHFVGTIASLWLLRVHQH
ncbi:DUF3611 family protein [Nostoc sp. FACHB-892]